MTLVNKIRKSFIKSKRNEKSSSKALEDQDTVATFEESSAGCSVSFEQGDSIDQALQLCERGRVLDSEADLEGAHGCLLEAVNLLEKMDSQTVNVTRCETYESIAYIQYKREEYAEAKGYYEKAKELRKTCPFADESKREEVEYLMEMVEMML